jgi:hypothetical protein
MLQEQLVPVMIRPGQPVNLPSVFYFPVRGSEVVVTD